MSDRIGDWIQTYTGRPFWPLDPRPEDVDIVDISHALSLICRFVGQCTKFYSVAEHSVRVSRIVPTLYALLHDAAEAYTGDICTQIKKHLTVDAAGRRLEGDASCEHFDSYEDHLLKTILKALGVPWPDTAELEAVKHADLTLLMTEKRDIMSTAPMPWKHKHEPLKEHIYPWSIKSAENWFLERYYGLKKLTQ